MTPDAASVLAARITTAWESHTASSSEWANALEQVTEGSAGTVFARLKRTQPNVAPSIVAFISMCAPDRPTAPAAPAPANLPREACHRCETTGWAPVLRWDDTGVERVVGTAPCSCSNGDRVRPAWEAAQHDRPRLPRALTDTERENGRARLAEIRASLTTTRSTP